MFLPVFPGSYAPKLLKGANIIKSTSNIIKISDKAMYQLGNHYLKHGKAMGYASKKEYDAAARVFANKYQNKAKIMEGIWNGKGALNGTTQRAIIYDGKTLIVDAKTGQIIDFYSGVSSQVKCTFFRHKVYIN